MKTPGEIFLLSEKLRREIFPARRDGVAEDERIRGDSIFQRWLLRGPSRLAFWRTISSGRVKVRLRLRDGLLTRLNIRHRHQDWA